MSSILFLDSSMICDMWILTGSDLDRKTHDYNVITLPSREGKHCVMHKQKRKRAFRL